MPVEANHACLCCGYHTLAVPPPGTWMTCPVCGWTDVLINGRCAENQLHDAQRAFVQLGASSPDLAGAALRPPRPEEERAPGWQPLPGVSEPLSRRDQAAATLIEEIIAAFGHVGPRGRVSLTEAYRSDHDADPPAGEPGADWSDRDEQWTAIPDQVLEYFADRSSVFIFGNVRSFQYYLPAYLVHDLRSGRETALDALLAASGQHAELLDARQRDAVRRYLRYLVDFTGPNERAERALNHV